MSTGRLYDKIGKSAYAKVELVTTGEHPTTCKTGSSNSVDTDELTTTKYVASVRGYHYVETENGLPWGSRDEYLTNYLTPGR